MAQILITDDSYTVLQIIQKMLTDSGHEALTATNGEEALRLATERQPDIVLLDVILPKLNGYEVCRQLKSQPQTAHIPIVMVTSKGKDRDRIWGLEQGADAYLAKPIDLEALLNVVSQLSPQLP